MDHTLKGVLISIGTGIGVALTTIILLYLPILNILVLVFPVPFIIIGVKKDLTHGLLGLASAIAVFTLLVDSLAGVYILALTLLPIGATIYALKKRLDPYESFLLASISTLASILLYLKTFSVIRASSFFDMIWQSLNSFFIEGPIDFKGILNTYHGLGLFKNFTSEQQLADFFINEIKAYVPFFILLTSFSLGLAIYLISRFAIKKMGYRVINILPFKYWQLPRGMGLGLLLLLLVAFLGSEAIISLFTSVLLTIRLIISFVFSLVGLAVIWFFLDTPRIHVALRWTIAILVVTFFSLSLGLTLIGMMDHIFNLRRIPRAPFTVKKK